MRAIFFDVDGVLIEGYHHNPKYRKLWSDNIEQDLGIRYDDLVKSFFIPLFGDIVIGKADLHETLQRALSDMGYENSARDVAHYWITRDSNVNQGVMDFVESLKSKNDLKLFIATNQEKNRADHLWNNLKFKDHFSDIFYSGRVGISKQDRRFFDHVSQTLKIDPRDCLLIDDTPSVIATAQEAGWQTLQFETADDLKNIKF